MKQMRLITCVGFALSLLGACTSDTSVSKAATSATTGGAVGAVTTSKGTDPTTVPASSAPAQTSAAGTVEPAASVAPTAPETTDTTPAIVAATKAFLATLTDTERTAVSFDFSNTAQRQNWSNLPEGIYVRAGLMWGNLGEASQNAWLKIMKTTLSQEGYDRVLAEQSADDALAATDSGGGGGGGLKFGSQYYWIAVIGTPSETEPWQWQWGGHHVTVNATIVGSEISLTPSFIGVQPATYDANGNVVRPLGDIGDEAFALVNSLDATQQGKAVLGGSLIDLVLGPGQDGRTLAAEGLAGADMTAEQQAAMLKLAGHYGGLLNAEDATARVAELQANLANTYFAWYGPTTAGNGMYFRISGPTIVVEYSGQSMGGDTSNHIHGVYRDPTNDYGAKLGAGIGG